jgi:energy-coupling factor transporter ATP-binding protein EcfA2
MMQTNQAPVNQAPVNQAPINQTPPMVAASQLEISNFRGIKDAKIKIHPQLTLVTGNIGAGKSSVLQAMRALATGLSLPIEGLKKKDVAVLIKDSHLMNAETVNEKGKISFAWAGGKIEISYPSCKVSGKTIKCSTYAAGFALPTNIPSKDLSKLLGILPTNQDFIDYVVAPMAGPDFNIPVEQIWESIERTGWDETHAKTVGKGQSLKDEWKKLSGQTYYAVQSRDFVPEFYIPDSTHESLTAALESSQKVYDYAVKSLALGEREREELQNLSVSQPAIEAKLGELSEKLKAVTSELTQAQNMLDVIPKAVNPQQAYECWSCHKFGTIHKGKLVEAQDPKAAEADAKASRTKVDDQQAVIKSLTDERNLINTQLGEARRDLDKAKDAAKKLNTAVVDAPPTVTPDQARADVELGRKRIDALKVKTECDDIFKMLVVNQYLCEQLGPEGLRKEILGTRLAPFNGLLQDLCTKAGWPVIHLDELLTPRFAGRPFIALSTGQQMTVNALLQVAITKLDQSQMIIIDEFGLLDRPYRNGLLTILLDQNIPAVLGCTYSDRSEVPQISEFGEAYWCENGEVESLMPF